MKEPSKEQIKDRTKHLRTILKEKHSIDLPQGHALEVMAKVFGFSDWNTASAVASSTNGETITSTKVESKSNKDHPPAFKLRTAGEFVDFFSKVDRNKPVFFNEYKESDLNNFGTLTSICCATYDYEIQNEVDIRLELNTEEEKNLSLKDFGKSASQKFSITQLGRFQRVVKWFNMQNGFWNRNLFSQSDKK